MKMIKGIGIDLILVKEVSDDNTKMYVDVILSNKERKLFENIPSKDGQLMFLAGRYAAKEAILKAAKRYNKNLKYHDFSVLDEEDGTMRVESEFISADEIIHVTMTHTKEYALAYAIIESK